MPFLILVQVNFTWNGALYAHAGGGLKDVSAFSVHPFEAGDYILQAVPARRARMSEYALLHKLADGVYAALTDASGAEIVDIVLPAVEGREIWLRRIAKLDEQQQSILHQLKMTLPERLEPRRIQKCSENSAIA